MREAESPRCAGSWVFPQVRAVGTGSSGKEKARSQGVSCGQMVAASAVPSWKLGAVGGSAGAGWLTEWVGWWTGGVLGLQDWAFRGPYGGRYETAREREFEGRSDGRGRVS